MRDCRREQIAIVHRLRPLSLPARSIERREFVSVVAREDDIPRANQRFRDIRACDFPLRVTGLAVKGVDSLGGRAICVT